MSEGKAKETDVTGEKPPKSSVVKIVILVVAVILLLAIAVGATLFVTGAFSSKPPVDVDVLVEGGGGKGGHGEAKGGHGEAKGGHGEAKGGHGEAKGGDGAAKKVMNRRRKRSQLTRTPVLKKATWTWMKRSHW
jgi:hypothetical protein